MNFLKRISDYFNFNRRERNGVIVLTTIVFILLAIKFYVSRLEPTNNISIQEITNEATLKIEKDSNISSSSNQLPNLQIISKDSSTLFPFDPNTISTDQAKTLGFSAKAANVLDNFRKKGGKFKTKEDLKKVYGVSEKLYSKLEAYIIIESDKKTELPKTEFVKEEKKFNKIIEINSADSLQLLSLNGIGPAFTKKILKYRNALGGFYKKEQLLEVYGMKDTLYQLFVNNIKIDADAIEKLNPNFADINRLKKHPYINYNVANAIVQYREKHGKYNALKDLKNTSVVNDELLKKIEPYLEF